MVCALCLQDRKLCNSHIVPDFIFKRLKEEEGCFYVFRSSSNRFKSFGKTFSEKLLCSECETLFSKWEGYAKKFFSDEIQLSGYARGNHFVLSGADYAKMTLFFMSLLWRFSVSTNPWMKGCSIGPHSERLRKHLLASDPLESWRYGCTLTAVMVDKIHVPDLIVPPSEVRVDGHRCVRLVVGGYLLTYFVSSHRPSEGHRNIVMQEDGQFILSRFELFEIPFLAEIAAAAARQELNES
jgi:hypothetical protein